MIENLSCLLNWVPAQLFKENHFQVGSPSHPIFYKLAPSADSIEHKFSEFRRAKRLGVGKPRIIPSFLPVPKRNDSSEGIPDHENCSSSKCLDMSFPPASVLVSGLVGEHCPAYSSSNSHVRRRHYLTCGESSEPELSHR